MQAVVGKEKLRLGKGDMDPAVHGTSLVSAYFKVRLHADWNQFVSRMYE